MLLDHHRAKIVPAEKLASLFGHPSDRLNDTVVMCHGVFDVVHPGHVRHLLYAKSKAEILVCSITSDRCADRKGSHRPHVPQDLRAACLACYDFVDYVVICDAPDPIALIQLLRPNFYAKGFEYSTEGRPEPIPEAAAVEAAGGELLFTPGDVVYSSSALIDAASPDLRYDRLGMVMRQGELTFDHLRVIVNQMKEQRVTIVGDTIVDRLTYCEVIGTSGKTPTLSVRRDRSVDFVGGAGVVAKHARVTGAKVKFLTILGSDSAGSFAVDDLYGADVELLCSTDIARPTTVKEAIVVGDHRLLKVDTVDNRPISDADVLRLAAHIKDAQGAVVFSDFRHGIFNGRSIDKLTDAIPADCLRVADSQVASRWGNVADFCGFDLLTPNEREARFALGDQDSGVRPLAARLRELAGARWLLMKMGPRGVLGFGPEDASLALDALAGAVRDPVGAGDAFLAYATLTLLVRPSLAAAAILGTMAAGAACEYDGNIPVSPDKVLAKIDEAEKELGS